MTFTQIVKDIFSRKPKQAEDNSQKGNAKAFLSKVSGAFMLPISVMAVAGLFLGVGAALDSHTSAKTFGAFIKALGDPIFGSMPALFAVAIIIAFTDEAGVAVFAGIVAFVVFNAIQGPFIDTTSTESLKDQMVRTYDLSATDATKYGISISNTGIVDTAKSTFTGLNASAGTGIYVNTTLYTDAASGNNVFAIVNSGGTTFADKQFVAGKMLNANFSEKLYKQFGTPSGNTGYAYFLNIKTSDDVAAKVFKIAGANWGIGSLNTSIFGGICVGSLVAYLYNKFHVIELPGAIAFFGGKRFVAIVSILMMIPLAFIFLLIWPWIGLGLAYFGEYSGKVSGLDSFIFGFAERSLIPFGLHHVFYAPLWWTNAGGDVVSQLGTWDNSTHFVTAIDGSSATTSDLITAITSSNSGNYMGDSFGWLALNGTGIKEITYTTNGTGGATAGDLHNLKLFDFASDQLGIRFGRFMQGKYPFMQLGLPAAGFAMVMAAPKEHRKDAFSVVFAASLTSFVTGVTEPIEFTFLFLAPWLFWGFHALMAGISFLLMNLLGAHVGMTFSGGFIDMIIYGALPISQGTHFWWMYVIGAAYAPIYYFVFYWAIKKFDLATPGRGGNAKLFTKADYKKSKVSLGGTLRPQSAALVTAAGGWDNITKFSNCATRLRYDVKDLKKIDKDALKAAGAVGVAPVGNNHIQIIMGPVAEQVNTNIKGNIGADLGKVKINKSETTPKKVTVVKAVTAKSVASGTAATLASLKDGVFSEKMMGDGIVVKFAKTAKKGIVYAPVSGELVTVFPTKHAYGIKTKEGIEVLVHIGLDTVNLKGEGFKTTLKQGGSIKAGEKLADVDLAKIRSKVPSVDPIVIVTSGQKVTKKATGKLTKTSSLFTIV